MLPLNYIFLGSLNNKTCSVPFAGMLHVLNAMEQNQIFSSTASVISVVEHSFRLLSPRSRISPVR